MTETEERKPYSTQVNRRLATSLVLADGISAGFAAFAVGSVLPLLGRSLNLNDQELGAILSAFVVAFALFQIPAGFVSLRWGARNTFLSGLVLVGALSIFVGLSSNLLELVITRFIAGLGYSFTGGTAYGLLASYYEDGNKGRPIGLYYGLTNGFGGILGIPIAVALGLAFGWGFPIKLSGVLTIGLFAISFLLLPRDRLITGEGKISDIWSKGRAVIRSRSIWALAFSLAGFTATSFALVDYTTQYFGQAHPTWGIGNAALVALVAVCFTIPGGLIGGRLAERKDSKRRIILLISCAVIAAILFAFPVLTLGSLWFLYALAGLIFGLGSTVMNVIPAYLPESKGEGLSLGIGIVNSTQLLFAGGFLGVFGFLAATYGFGSAWIACAIVTLILVPLLALVSPT